MKKIVIAAWGEPTDEKVWSKTPSILVKRFSDDEEDLETFNLQSFEKSWMKILSKIISKLFRLRIMTRSFLVHYFYEKKYDVFIKNHTGDKILFIAEHCSKRSYQDVGQYVYMDSVLRPYYKYDKKTSLFAKLQLSQYEACDKRSLKSMTKIFTQNQWTKDFLVNEYSIDESKVFNVHFGVNLKPLQIEKNYEENLLLIVLRKGTERLKGLNLLLEAFPIVKKAVPNVRLAVVGTQGPDIEGIDYYYNQPREVTVELFKRSTLYTMPALFEPNGITYLEALANKTPIVGLNRFALPEFTGYGKYGFIVSQPDKKELAEVIISALSDKEKLSQMGNDGQKYVMSNFSWQKTYEVIKNEMYK